MSNIIKPQINSRTQVIKTLINVQNGYSLSNMLDNLLAEVNDDSRSFVHNLLLTTLRHWHATARLLDSLADKPVDEVEVRTTIQVGITQLIYLDVADHASIFETVQAVKELDFARASGLVNAILRKVSKNPNKYRKQCDKKHSLPNWLAKQLKQDWRQQYDQLCSGLRLSAPMFLRVNNRQSTETAYSQLLSEMDVKHSVQELSFSLDNNTEYAKKLFHVKPICLTNSLSVSQLPQFDTGMDSVQDAHASLAGMLVQSLLHKLKLSQGSQQLHVLDACTAPSGKLAHCLELFDENEIVKLVETKVGKDEQGNDKILLEHEKHDNVIADVLSNDTGNSSIKFTAIDNEPSRLERSKQTLTRIGLINQAKLICADATTWQLNKTDTTQFDVILLDAPCTATGVIRRHPDITLLRKETDIAQTVELQKQILDNLWSQLKSGGYLIYATCSIFKSENVEQMQNFLTNHIDAEEVKINADWGFEQVVGRQCLPIVADGGDGFYYAVLNKK